MKPHSDLCRFAWVRLWFVLLALMPLPHVALAQGSDVETLRHQADRGDALAQWRLGFMYNHGHGVPQNHATAVRWYRAAAEQGLALAQNNLGFMYGHGHGVPQNHATAVRWYRAAAEQGLAEAQHNLGLLYELGQGVSRNPVSAHMWVNLAAAKMGASADLRDRIASRMTPEQIAQAQRRASACSASSYRNC